MLLLTLLCTDVYSVDCYAVLALTLTHMHSRMNRTSKGQPAAASPELYINQMVSSSLDWRDVGLRIKQTASFSGPRNTAFTKLEFESNSSGASPQVVVKLRIPGWVKEGAAEVKDQGHSTLSNPAQPAWCLY